MQVEKKQSTLEPKQMRLQLEQRLAAGQMMSCCCCLQLLIQGERSSLTLLRQAERVARRQPQRRRLAIAELGSLNLLGLFDLQPKLLVRLALSHSRHLQAVEHHKVDIQEAS